MRGWRTWRTAATPACLGVAAGLTFGTLLALVTLVQFAVQPVGGPRIDLLSNYFYGYTVSPAGALIGAAFRTGTGLAGKGGAAVGTFVGGRKRLGHGQR